MEGEDGPRRDGVGGERGSLNAPIEAGKQALDDRCHELRAVRRAHPGNARIPRDLTDPKNEGPLVAGEVGGGLGEERGPFGYKGFDHLLGDDMWERRGRIPGGGGAWHMPRLMMVLMLPLLLLPLVGCDRG